MACHVRQVRTTHSDGREHSDWDRQAMSRQSLPARRPSGPGAGRWRIALVGAMVTVEPSTVAAPSTSRLKPSAAAGGKTSVTLGVGGDVRLRVAADAVDDDPVADHVRPHRQHVRLALLGHRDEVGELELADLRRQLPHLDLDAHGAPSALQPPSRRGPGQAPVSSSPLGGDKTVSMIRSLRSPCRHANHEAVPRPGRGRPRRSIGPRRRRSGRRAPWPARRPPRRADRGRRAPAPVPRGRRRGRSRPARPRRRAPRSGRRGAARLAVAEHGVGPRHQPRRPRRVLGTAPRRPPPVVGGRVRPAEQVVGLVGATGRRGRAAPTSSCWRRSPSRRCALALGVVDVAARRPAHRRAAGQRLAGLEQRLHRVEDPRPAVADARRRPRAERQVAVDRRHPGDAVVGRRRAATRRGPAAPRPSSAS